MVQRWLVSLAVMGSLAGTAWGQAGSVGIGGGGGWAVPVGALEDRFNDGPSYGGWMSTALLENVDVQVAFQQSFLDERGDENFIFDTTDLTITTASVGPKVFFLDSTRVFRPFVAGGLGYTRLEADDARPDNPIQDDDRFGFNLGGGFDLGRPSWAFTIEARYYRNLGSDDEDDFGYIVPTGGFTFRFL